MESSSFSAAVEMYQKDIDELETFISQSKRQNIKRHLEEHKRNLGLLLDEEKRKSEKEKADKEKKETQKDTSATSQKEGGNLTYEAISKYAFDGSGNKFVK
jgi:hypothetical protein